MRPYGALSAAGGRVELTWSLTDDAFGLAWRESGGPAVVEPDKVGFGDRLIREGLGRALRGQLALDYRPTGLTCTVTAPPTALGTQA